MHRALDHRLQALEEQAQLGRGGYVVMIDDGPQAIVTVDGVDIPLVEYERCYPGAVVIDIGGAGDATHAV